MVTPAPCVRQEPNWPTGPTRAPHYSLQRHASSVQTRARERTPKPRRGHLHIHPRNQPEAQRRGRRHRARPVNRSAPAHTNTHSTRAQASSPERAPTGREASTTCMHTHRSPRQRSTSSAHRRKGARPARPHRRESAATRRHNRVAARRAAPAGDEPPGDASGPREMAILRADPAKRSVQREAATGTTGEKSAREAK